MTIMPLQHFFDPLVFSTELAFTVLAVFFCFLIYFRTKESYDLTKYKGIMYFRYAFLFLGLSYVFRFLFSIIMISRVTPYLFSPRSAFMPFFIMLLGYFSTIGIFYLFSGSIKKHLKAGYLVFFGHLTAVLLSVIAFLTRSHFILLYLQCAFLALAAILTFMKHDRKKRISHIKVLYLLVAVLWLTNLLVVDRRAIFSFEIRVFLQAVSLVVFVAIYYRISKWVR